MNSLDATVGQGNLVFIYVTYFVIQDQKTLGLRRNRIETYRRHQ